jgi:hypothetical protein
MIGTSEPRPTDAYNDVADPTLQRADILGER